MRIFIFSLCFISVIIADVTISNVQARQEGLEIIITYDMTGELQDYEEIVIGYSTDGGLNYELLVINYDKTYIFENWEQDQREESLVFEQKIVNSERENSIFWLYTDLGKNIKPGTGKEISFMANEALAGKNTKFQVNVKYNWLLQEETEDVIGKRTILNYDRQLKSEEATIEVRVSNIRSEPVLVRIVEHISGDWVVSSASHSYMKMDASTIHFPIILDPVKTKTVYYTYRKEWK